MIKIKFGKFETIYFDGESIYDMHRIYKTNLEIFDFGNELNTLIRLGVPFEKRITTLKQNTGLPDTQGCKPSDSQLTNAQDTGYKIDGNCIYDSGEDFIYIDEKYALNLPAKSTGHSLSVLVYFHKDNPVAWIMPKRKNKNSKYKLVRGESW